MHKLEIKRSHDHNKCSIHWFLCFDEMICHNFTMNFLSERKLKLYSISARHIHFFYLTDVSKNVTHLASLMTLIVRKQIIIKILNVKFHYGWNCTKIKITQINLNAGKTIKRNLLESCDIDFHNSVTTLL